MRAFPKVLHNIGVLIFWLNICLLISCDQSTDDPPPNINKAPISSADTFTTDENISFTTENVINNDSDADGDMLLVSSIDTALTLGTVTNNNDGTFYYVPPSNYHGTDSFTYTITDGMLFDTSVVTIIINSIPDIQLLKVALEAFQYRISACL